MYWLSKNAPLSRRFLKKRLMDCLRYTTRPPESVARDGTHHRVDVGSVELVFTLSQPRVTVVQTKAPVAWWV